MGIVGDHWLMKCFVIVNKFFVTGHNQYIADCRWHVRTRLNRRRTRKIWCYKKFDYQANQTLWNVRHSACDVIVRKVYSTVIHRIKTLAASLWFDHLSKWYIQIGMNRGIIETQNYQNENIFKEGTVGSLLLFFPCMGPRFLMVKKQRTVACCNTLDFNGISSNPMGGGGRSNTNSIKKYEENLGKNFISLPLHNAK